MLQYSLSIKENSLVEKNQLLLPQDITSCNSSEIDEYNHKDFSEDKTFKYLFRPEAKAFVDSYIIPTSDGKAINGYLVRKFRKRPSDPTALIIYIHDGGWMLGNMDKSIAIASNISARTGAWVLVPDYRLAPKYKFPIPVEDCFDAYMWALQGTKYWKLDSSKLYLMGCCCGANLCAGISKLIRDRKVERPEGQILIEPVADCRLRTQSVVKHKDNPMLSKRLLEFFVTNYQREPKDVMDPLFSPLLTIDLSRLEKTLIFGAERDILADDARLFAEALSKADTPVKLIMRENAIHGFMNFPKSDGFKETMDAVNDFVHGAQVENIEIISRFQRFRKERNRGPVVLS